MGSLKAGSFLWLVAEEEVRERPTVKRRFSTAETRATGQGPEAASRTWEWDPTESQQEKGDNNPMTTNSWILPTVGISSEETLSSRWEHSGQPLISACHTLSRESTQAGASTVV